jgi:hypothetical protein
MLVYSLHLHVQGKQSKKSFWTALTLKMKALKSFEMSGTTRHISDDVNPQQHCCGQLKGHRIPVEPTHHDDVLDLEEGLWLDASDSLDRPAILWPTWMGSGLSCCVLVAILARHSSCNEAPLNFTPVYDPLTAATTVAGDRRLHTKHVTGMSQ